MSLPTSGQLAMSDIRNELDVVSQSPFSLSGATMGAYATLNNCSASKPNQTTPYQISEWYNYCHLCICNVFCLTSGSTCNCTGCSSLIPIIFTNLVNFQESPLGTWGPVTVNTSDYYGGKGTTCLQSNTNGYLIYDITDNGTNVNNFNIGLGFGLSNVLVPGDSYDYFVYVEGSNGNYKTYDISNGYIDSNILAVSGDQVKLERSGTTVYAKYYRSGIWNNIITFPLTASSILHVYGDGYDIGEYEYIVNPKGFNLDLALIYENTFNMSQTSPGIWKSGNGTTKFCGFGTSYFESGQSCYYYVDYVANSDYVAIALSTSIISDCDNVPFDAEFFLSPQVNQEYRIHDPIDGFLYLGVTGATNDKFGLFRSTGGTVTAKYYRSGVWNTMHTFTTTSTARLYPSVEGTLETCIVTNPMASNNLI